jgi:hypothetical protein
VEGRTNRGGLSRAAAFGQAPWPAVTTSSITGSSPRYPDPMTLEFSWSGSPQDALTVRQPELRRGECFVELEEEAGFFVVGLGEVNHARVGPTSMRKPQSRPARDDCGTSQTSIYERAFVKRGWCRFRVAGFPHIPLAVGFGRSGPSQTCPRPNGRATRNTSSEPEAEGEFVSLHAGSVRSVAERDVIRSTIYSGSPGLPDVATKPESKGRHHSFSR